MKVLLISNIDFPVSHDLTYGATQRVVYALAKELQQLGTEVIVCCSGDSDELEGARYATVKRALGQPVGDFNTDRELYERHFELSLERALSAGSDIVHDHSFLLLSDAYRRYESALRMPVLTTLHGAVTADSNPERCTTYRQRAGPNVFFNCVGQHQAELYRQHIDICGVVHNGLFLDDYQLQSQKKDYLFILGRIICYKGQDIAIEVAEKTGRKLIIAGPIIEPDYFGQFRSRVRMMPHIGAIPVTPSYFPEVVEPVLARPEPAVYIGELNDEQKDVWFGHAACFLMPISWDEPFPLVLLEAMACGSPVLAFNRGGVSESVVDQKTGFLLETVDDMVEAIRNVGQIDPLECRRHVEEHFSSQAMCQGYLDLYGKLITRTIDPRLALPERLSRPHHNFASRLHDQDHGEQPD